MEEELSHIIRGLIRTNRTNVIYAETQAQIIEQARMLRSQHSQGDMVDLDYIFAAQKIRVIEDERVVEPNMVRRSTMAAYAPPLVFFPIYGTPQFRAWYKAHELGHAILHGDINFKNKLEKEQEANLFARELIGGLPLRIIRNHCIERHIALKKEPLKSMKAEYDQNQLQYLMNLIA